MSAAVYPPIRFEDHRPRRVDDERQSDYDGEPVRPEPQAERIEQHGTFRMIPDCVLDLGKSDATQLYGTMLRLARSKDYCTASAVDLAKLAKLSEEAPIDEVLGLRADLSDAKATVAKLTEERNHLKRQVSELSAKDGNAMIRELQIQVNNANNAKWREGEKTKDALKQVYALKKELKRLGAVEIPL